MSSTKGKFVFREKGSVPEAVTGPPQEAPPGTAFSRATKAFLSSTKADEEVIRNNIEFMLKTLDMESQTLIIKDVILNYVARRMASATSNMSSDPHDIYDDIAKAALGEVVFPSTLKHVFTELDGIIENIGYASKQNSLNWAEAYDLLQDNPEKSDQVPKTVKEDNLQRPVVDNRNQLVPDNISMQPSAISPSDFPPPTVPPFTIPTRRRSDSPRRIIADKILLKKRASIERNETTDGFSVASLQPTFVRSSGEASGSGNSSRAYQSELTSKGNGKGKGKEVAEN